MAVIFASTICLRTGRRRLVDAAVSDLGRYGSGRPRGNDLSESAEGHQLDDADVGNVADLVGVHEHIPGVLGAILDAEGNLALLGVEEMTYTSR